MCFEVHNAEMLALFTRLDLASMSNPVCVENQVFSKTKARLIVMPEGCGVGAY